MNFAPALAFVLAAAALAPAVASAAGTLSPEEQQWQLAGGQAVKIAVTRDGWYRVSRPSLLAAGLDRSARNRSFRLFADGREVPITIRRDRSIEFFGVRRTGPTTDARVYWLTWSGGTGKRIRRARGTVKRRKVARTFGWIVAERPRDVYYGWLKGGPSDLFFGPLVTPDAHATQSISAPGLDPRSRPRLDVAVQGFSIGPSPDRPRTHEVSVSVNGKQVGTTKFENRAVGHVVARVPAGLLKRRGNNVTVSTGDGDLDWVMLWRVEVRYARLFQATGDRLGFRLARRQSARVRGFTTRRVRLFNITKPSAPQVMRAKVRRTGKRYTLLVPASSRTRRFFAVAEGGVLTPASVTAERPSSWHGTDHGADMVIVSHADFIPSLGPLVALHESEGLQVDVVDVGDLYDEFTFGVPGPKALRLFLRRAYETWRPRPRFLLLVGDASYDPKDYLGAGDRDYVPTQTIEIPLTHVPSDDALADFDRDGVPELAVGRLPVQTAAEARAVVHKIVSYETEPGVTERPALFVADHDPAVDIEGIAGQLEALLPAALPVQRLYRRDSPTVEDFKPKLIDALDAGPGLVDYVGHGGPTVWGRDNFLNPVDAYRLTNADRLSLYVMTSCLNAWFVDPKDEALGESFLKAPDGGAIAVLSSSALETGEDGLAMNGAILRELVAPGSWTIGEIVTAAKRAAGGGNLTRTTLLFGDPASRLR